MESTEVISQNTNTPDEIEASTSETDGIGKAPEVKAKGENHEVRTNVQTSNPEAVHRNVVEDGGTIQIGEIDVQLVTQPHDFMNEISQEVVEGGCVIRVNPLQTTTDRVLEHSSDSGSKAKFIFRSNQGSKSVGWQRGRKQRMSGSVTVPESQSSFSQAMKLYDNFAEQSFEDDKNRSSTKEQAKKKVPSVGTSVYDDNDPSTTRTESQRDDEERPQGTPNRRSALSTITPSELNIRMGGVMPNQSPEKCTPIKSVATSNNLTPIQVTPTTTVESELSSPTLSRQQPGFRDESDIDSEFAEETSSVIVHDHDDSMYPDEEGTIESALEKYSVELYGHDDSSEHHDSDKENVPVHEMFLPGPGSMKLSRGFDTTGRCTRKPLQTLYSAPSSSMYQSPDIFTTPTASKQLLRASLQVEAGRPWQMVTDTNCLLNADSLESIKQLEGLLETRLVIPNIVVRELDYLQKQEVWKASACYALQWIEACMLKMPSWIHVQASGETVHVAMTPPVSPSIYSRGLHLHVGESDMMHPTLHDHVLECALFQRTIPDGRVAVLTDDTTLKIKALAEGLVVDTAATFSDSLLNPYSDRFIYSGSTPIGRSFCHHEVLSTPRSTISSSKWPAPVSRLKSKPDTPRPTSRANFSIWCNSQPLGLQALLV